MNIPNSFSTEDLQKALESAPKENESKSPDFDEEAYTKQIIEIDEKHLGRAFEELADPVLHKAMAVIILQNLCSYHERRSISALEEQEPQLAGIWARDCGQLMAALKIIQETSVSPTDFMAPK